MITRIFSTPARNFFYGMISHYELIFVIGLFSILMQSKAVPAQTGQEVVVKMIEAHGGITKWRSAPTVSFEVTYASLLPSGVEATPPHILVYETFATVDGLVVPTRYSIFEKDHTLYATCEIRDWSFKKPFDASRMVISPNAVVDTSNPKRAND